MSHIPRHLVLVGATASGKSSLAVQCARKKDAAIISLDSMQIYRGMEIGTGVIPEVERIGVEHHMISCREPSQAYSVKHFQSDVNNVLNAHVDKRFVLVGGTGLYTHAIVDNFAFAETDDEVRAHICANYGLDENDPDEDNVAAAYAYLESVDRDAALKIDPLNVRRIVRALEAIELSGSKFSDVGEGIQKFGDPAINVVMAGLRYSRDVLRQRIVTRIDDMFNQGWVDEVQALIGQWDELTASAQNAIGYNEIMKWIVAGKNLSELDDVKELIAHRTAQFSRRQRKWFERDPRIVWIDCDDLDAPQIVAQLIDVYHG